jgi:hypothetical protein
VSSRGGSLARQPDSAMMGFFVEAETDEERKPTPVVESSEPVRKARQQWKSHLGQVSAAIPSRRAAAARSSEWQRQRYAAGRSAHGPVRR